MADRHVIYKNGAKEIAYLKGAAVTFMAKPIPTRRFELSSALEPLDKNGKRNLFARTKRSLNITSQARLLWDAPLVSGMPPRSTLINAISPVFCADAPRLRERHRTCGLRVVGEGNSLRIENRVPGADANPISPWPDDRRGDFFLLSHFIGD